MLAFAYEWQNELMKEHRKSLRMEHMEKFKYFYAGRWTEYEFEVADNDLDELQMVSVNPKTWRIHGYFEATFDNDVKAVEEMCIINYMGKVCPMFAADLKAFIAELFGRGYEKIDWSVIIGNPAERMYDRFCKKYGGRIVGTKLRNVMLRDGNIYDEKFYEIYRDGCQKHRKGKG